jgi:hypothetical protein
MIDEGIAPQPGGVLLGNVAYIPPGFEGFYKEPFYYNVIFNNIGGAGTVQTLAANVQNDSYFVCTKQMATIFDQATGLVNTSPIVAPMRVRILDSSSGKFQMDQPTAISNIFGTAAQPSVLLYRSRLYMPGGQITVELTNNMAAAQQVQLTFEGFKVYSVPDSLSAM